MPLSVERTRVVALGIDRAPFPAPRPIDGLPIRADRPLRVGFVGHCLHHKGPHVLLGALARLPGRPVEVELFGKRHSGHSYDAAFSKLLACEPRATHRGPFADRELAAILSSVDVLAVPSTCLESFGIATREAFLAGRPVVTSDRGALPESVRDGVDGLVVPAEDPSVLAAALGRLLDEPDLLPALARGAVASGNEVKTIEQYAAEIDRFLYVS